MSTHNQTKYQCSVVDEIVKIHLRKKMKAGWMSQGVYFVQCDQLECQYVEENLPPCPLSLSMFEQEMRERDELARQRRSTDDDY